MSDIFISYASQDRDRVEPLARALEDEGWSVWWDRTIPPGKTFDVVIEEAINAASCVVVLWSERSIESDWVKEEANIGKERRILVPAKIDPVDLPLGFGRIQAADLTNWGAETSHPGFSSLRAAISEVAGPPRERGKGAEDPRLSESNAERHLEAASKESETSRPDPGHLEPVAKESPITGPKGPRKKWFASGIAAVALISVLGVIGWFFFPKPASYTISASSGPNGSISPTGSVSVSHGDSKSFEITPGRGCRIADVKVDGISVGAVPSYAFDDVASNRTIEASFERNRFEDMGDGTVRDDATGLYWLKNADCTDGQWIDHETGSATLERAKWAAADLAHGTCGLSDESRRGDWRLPTVEEWDSLTDRKYYRPALLNTRGKSQWKPGDPFIITMHNYPDQDSFWTSSVCPASIPGYGIGCPSCGERPVVWDIWFGGMNTYQEQCTNKPMKFRVWPVRNALAARP